MTSRPQASRGVINYLEAKTSNIEYEGMWCPQWLGLFYWKFTNQSGKYLFVLSRFNLLTIQSHDLLMKKKRFLR